MAEEKIQIKFEATNSLGDHYVAETNTSLYCCTGDTELSVMGEQFSVFLSQMGYYRPNGYILMDDITEEEMWELEDYLHELRGDKKSGQDSSD